MTDMLQVSFGRFGPPEVLESVRAPIPEPADNQVLIGVTAAGVNFGHTMQRAGRYTAPIDLPCVLGTEAAGTVVATGTSVDGIAAGQRVVSVTWKRRGTYAEYVVVDRDDVYAVPDGVDDVAAIGVLAQGLTAHFLVEGAVGVEPGESVVVHAAAGGVGSLLVQILRRRGAKVIATASTTAKLELAARLGAQRTVDYTDERWSDTVLDLTDGRGADVVFDAVGGAVSNQGLRCLARSGRLVLYGAASGSFPVLHEADLERLLVENQAVVGFGLPGYLDHHPEQLRPAVSGLLESVARGELEVLTGPEFRLSDAASAHRAIEARSTVGKVVLRP